MQTPLKIGIIGFDTSHVAAFTKLLNDSTNPHHIPGGRIVAGFPSFSPDLESSASRVEGYTAQMKEEFSIDIVDSIDALIEKSDAILLESVDGRRHLAEATPVIKARKPLYVDKPLAHNYEDAAAIVQLAQEYSCPIMSSSSLRYDANLTAIKNDPDLGEILACDAFSPATLDPTNPGLFWYGIHGVEILYSFMGAGCRSVRCVQSEGYDVVTAIWDNGRIATMRGTRMGTHGYGATVFGAKKIAQTTYSTEVPIYAQLLRKIIPFLQSGESPIPVSETLEIMAFMQASLVSANENREVALSEITG